MREYKRFERVVSISEKAVRFHRSPSYLPEKGNISKRGKILEFSSHSALRLREALAFSELKSASITFGVCLTLPWQMSAFKDFDLDLCTLYRECFHRFTISFRRKFPNSAAIFRHELQARKIPHAHLVVYFSSFDLRIVEVLRSKRTLENDLKLILSSLWLKALQNQFYGGSVAGFLKYGVKVEKLDGSPAAIRYICDHESKHKQAQLGYIGKQWGYIARALIVPSGSVKFCFSSGSNLVKFTRSVRRLCQFHVDAPTKQFGKKLIPSCRLRSINFVSSKTAYKLCEYIEKNYRNPIDSYSGYLI